MEVFMSITAIIELKIEDYEKFEASFASRESARTAAGIDAKAYRDMDDARQGLATAWQRDPGPGP